jgi:hypothetical protein
VQVRFYTTTIRDGKLPPVTKKSSTLSQFRTEAVAVDTTICCSSPVLTA